MENEEFGSICQWGYVVEVEMREMEEMEMRMENFADTDLTWIYLKKFF